MLVFYVRVSPGLARVDVADHPDSLDGPVLLELATDLGLGGVVVDAAQEERLEGVGRRLGVGVGVPERDLLLQLVRYLLLLLALLALQSGNQ